MRGSTKGNGTQCVIAWFVCAYSFIHTSRANFCWYVHSQKNCIVSGWSQTRFLFQFGSPYNARLCHLPKRSLPSIYFCRGSLIASAIRKSLTTYLTLRASEILFASDSFFAMKKTQAPEVFPWWGPPIPCWKLLATGILWAMRVIQWHDHGPTSSLQNMLILDRYNLQDTMHNNQRLYRVYFPSSRKAIRTLRCRS